MATPLQNGRRSLDRRRVVKREQGADAIERRPQLAAALAVARRHGKRATVADPCMIRTQCFHPLTSQVPKIRPPGWPSRGTSNK